MNDYAHDIIEYNEAVDILLGMLKTLSHRERIIVDLRFGLTDGLVFTLEEVGRIFRMTRARVREIQNNALRRLYHVARANQHMDVIMRGIPEPPQAPRLDELGAIGPAVKGTARLAELLGVPVNGVYKMVARGELPSVKLGRRVRIPHCDLQVFIDALRNIE